MTLYDTLPDVLRKAMIGLDLEPAAIASRLGYDLREFRQRLENDDLSLDLIAKAAGLKVDGLKALSGNRTFPKLPAWIRRLELPFDDETVNAWWIESDSAKVLIDTGLRAADLRSALDYELPDQVWITHEHHDHIGGLAALPSEVPVVRPADLFPGETRTIGDLRITVHDLAGHHPHALGYEIRRSDEVAFAAGDAVFASSMGGCPDAAVFQTACRTLGAALAKLPGTALLLPGHGSPSTVALEKCLNPFVHFWFPEAGDFTP